MRNESRDLIFVSAYAIFWEFPPVNIPARRLGCTIIICCMLSNLNDDVKPQNDDSILLFEGFLEWQTWSHWNFKLFPGQIWSDPVKVTRKVKLLRIRRSVRIYLQRQNVKHSSSPLPLEQTLLSCHLTSFWPSSIQHTVIWFRIVDSKQLCKAKSDQKVHSLSHQLGSLIVWALTVCLQAMH